VKGRSTALMRCKHNAMLLKQINIDASEDPSYQYDVAMLGVQKHLRADNKLKGSYSKKECATRTLCDCQRRLVLPHPQQRVLAHLQSCRKNEDLDVVE
jgi:hypothetical protein